MPGGNRDPGVFPPGHGREDRRGLGRGRDRTAVPGRQGRHWLIFPPRRSSGTTEFTCGVLAASHFGNTKAADREPPAERAGEDEGALVLVAAMDIPLLPHQLRRIVRSLVARMDAAIPSGSFSDAVLGAAFTTANAMTVSEEGPLEFEFRSVADIHLDGIAEAAFRAAEEAVIHSLLQARPVRGRSGRILETISPERLAGIFQE